MEAKYIFVFEHASVRVAGVTNRLTASPIVVKESDES